MSLIIFFIIITFMTAIQTAIPYLVKRTVVFGISIPEPFIEDEKLRWYKKSYSLIVSLISVTILGMYTVWALISNPGEKGIVFAGTMIEFGILFMSMSLYFYFHGKTAQIKKTKKFTESFKQVKMADLGIRSLDEMLPWYVFLLPVLITVGLAGYTLIQYDILPEEIPTHWGPSGADAFTTKNPISAISMMLVLLVIQLMFLAINVGTKSSGIKLSATNVSGSRSRQLTLRKYTSWFMFFMSVLLTLMMCFFQLTTIHPDLFLDMVMMATPLVFLILVLVGTVIFAVKVGASEKQTDVKYDENIADFDEDHYWKGGLFYFNRNDPSIFVEKRFGIGWTINFANPIAYVIVIVPVILILLISFL